MVNIKEALRSYFENKEEIIAVYLYGSAVAGKDVTGSDIDIALLVKPYKDPMESYRARVRYQIEISQLTGRNIDLVFLREAGELLSFEILKTGTVVFERNKEMHHSFRSLRLIQCLDFQFLESRMQKGMIAAMRRVKAGK